MLGGRFLMRATRLSGAAGRRIVALLATILIGLFGLGVGAAYAYLTSHGAGSGAASTGTASQVNVIAVAGGNSPASTLVPGGSADLVLEFNNPNAYPVTIVGIAQNGNVTPSNGTGPGTACAGPTGDNTGVGVTNSVLNVSVPSGNNVVVHIDTANGGVNGATMSTSSASGCQGATFQIPVTVTVRR
jgi:hypothetical protein